MRARFLKQIVTVLAALSGGLALPVGARAQSACETLAAKLIPDAASIVATQVAANGMVLPKGSIPANPGLSISGEVPSDQHGAFCRVVAVLKPAASSHIRTEVWLPLAGWNGKFIGVGNFGWGGDLPYSNMMAGLQKGYAVAGNDTGHDSSGSAGHGGKFLLSNPEGLIDYAYRANHDMTVLAKAMITRFYGSGPKRSYWIGCSLGGLQGLIEARRFPEDYDGIVAGAPPNPLTLFNAAQLWPNWLINRNPAMALSPAKHALVNAAVIKACASSAGKQLGYVDQPLNCAFDPRILQCKPGSASGEQADCLTKAQVEFVRLVWRGPANPRNGKILFPGPAKGSELEWGPFTNGKEFGNALDLFRYAAFQDPQWSSFKMNWTKDIDAAVAKVGPYMHVDEDLTAFTGRGGRLLLYVGWNDYHNPLELADYMKRVHSRIGDKADHYVRMFAIPGMNHCASGKGCDAWDKIDAIDAWVDRKAGRQPRSIARYEQGKVVLTQPLCFWPEMPVYNGHGPVSDKASYACKTI